MDLLLPYLEQMDEYLGAQQGKTKLIDTLGLCFDVCLGVCIAAPHLKLKLSSHFLLERF